MFIYISIYMNILASKHISTPTQMYYITYIILNGLLGAYGIQWLGNNSIKSVLFRMTLAMTIMIAPTMIITTPIMTI